VSNTIVFDTTFLARLDREKSGLNLCHKTCQNQNRFRIVFETFGDRILLRSEIKVERELKMLVGYVRVSTEEQSIRRQIDELARYGIDERNVYKEKATGTRRERPELNRLMSELKQGDTVIVTELTRLSRSTTDLFEIVERIHSKGADVRSLAESWLDTTTSQGKLMFTLFAGLSQFERDLISERTKEGLRAAKVRGRKGGRPSKLHSPKAENVKILYRNKVKIADICASTGFSRSTVCRVIREMREEKQI
jgi:DNA invertase Pin-like site-specific DNA recombinase